MRGFLKVIKNQDMIITCSNEITETFNKKSIEKEKYILQIEKKENKLCEILEKMRKVLKLNKSKIDDFKKNLKELDNKIGMLIEKKKN